MNCDTLASAFPQAGPFPPGSVCLIGAGPGDPSLITVKGAVRLAQADLVLYDRLAEPVLTILGDTPAELVRVGRHPGDPGESLPRAIELMIQAARANRRVARLKGGDPLIFSRGGEECQALAGAGVPFEIVPGITAASAVSACAGLPLTDRRRTSSLALASGHADPDQPDCQLDFHALAKMGTIALYMSVKRLAANCGALVAAGLSPGTPAAIISHCSLPQQRIITGTLEDLPERAAAARITTPALVIIGQVVALGGELGRF